MNILEKINKYLNGIEITTLKNDEDLEDYHEKNDINLLYKGKLLELDKITNEIKDKLDIDEENEIYRADKNVYIGYSVKENIFCMGFSMKSPYNTCSYVIFNINGNKIKTNKIKTENGKFYSDIYNYLKKYYNLFDLYVE